MLGNMLNEQLSNIRCYLVDMDGTLYLGNRLLPGAQEFISLLNEKKIQYLFLTNNSSKSAGDYQQKLLRLGIVEPKEKILTSGEATCLHLQKTKPGARVFLVGTPSLKEEFLFHEFTIVQEKPDIVVLGFDTTVTFNKLSMMCDFLRSGLPYIATHPDINCPTEKGDFMPDIGALIAFAAACTRRQPDVIIGKPHQPMLDAVMIKTHVRLDQIAMIGDRLYTDIAMGRAGIHTILVLSGETSREDAQGSPFQANLIVDDLADLFKRLS